MLKLYVQGLRALAIGCPLHHVWHVLALIVPLTVVRVYLLEWDPGLQPGRPDLAQWSTLARLVILYHSQLFTLAVLLVVKARAEARASHLRGFRTALGVAQAEVVAVRLQQQVWLLIWHHAHLFPPCRLGSSKSSLVQLQSLHHCL